MPGANQPLRNGIPQTLGQPSLNSPLAVASRAMAGARLCFQTCLQTWPLSSLRRDGALGYDLHGLLCNHVRGHRPVAHGQCLHDALHVHGPAVLRGGANAWRVSQARTHDDLLDLIAGHLFHELCQRLKLRLDLLASLLLVLSSKSKPSLVPDFNFFPSNYSYCCTTYSSMGSTTQSTSMPFLSNVPLHGEEDKRRCTRLRSNPPG
jgi:hypothetical protein